MRTLAFRYFAQFLQASFLAWYILASNLQPYALIAVLLFIGMLLGSTGCLLHKEAQLIQKLSTAAGMIFCIFYAGEVIAAWATWLLGSFAP